MSSQHKKSQRQHASPPTQEDQLRQKMAERDERVTMPDTKDEGDAISEASLYDASGAATGGGVDLPTHVEERTEEEESKHKHIHQGTNAYTGGGADNGSNL